MGCSFTISRIAASTACVFVLIQFAVRARRRARLAFAGGLIASFSTALVASAVGPSNTLAPSSEWVVRSWQTEDGLPQNTVNALVQTRDGFLWVGTSGGLASRR